MSLQPQAVPPIPEEAARVARAAFAKGNRYNATSLVDGMLYRLQELFDLVLHPLKQRKGHCM